MKTKDLQALLQNACPELTWVVDGHKVCADGTKLWANVETWGGVPILWLQRGSFKRDRVYPEDSLTLRNEVWQRLTKGEVRTHPGARLLDARVRLLDARDLVASWTRYTADARHVLASHEAALAAAQADLIAAEAHAAKVESA